MRRLVNIRSAGGGGGPTTLAGDVNGPSGSNSVDKIKGQPLAGNTPTFNEVLVWSGTEWVAGPVPPPSPPSQVVYFVMNGDIVTYPLATPIDGQRCAIGGYLISGRVMRRVDTTGTGAGGNTTGTIYVNQSGVDTSIGYFSIPQGSGDNYQTTVSVIGSTYIFTADYVYFVLDSICDPGDATVEQDITLSLVFNN